ncbi:MAG: lipid-binding SYLF domain-containing protein [Rhodospirillales bacterium]|nr:lipid-binding SYLF domain-containing protein [Rhodospirillales bacterium]
MMKKIGSGIAVLALAFNLAACAASTPADTAAILDKARWTVETFKQRNEAPMGLFRDMLQDAAGAAIFPGVIKAGFLIGAEGGTGVLIARNDAGWGQPAFYTLGAGSFGFQAGGQITEMVLVIRNKGAVESLIKHQGKIGADLEITVGTLGGGMEGAITTNLGADIVVFAQSAGLFGGVSLEGAALIRRKDLNEIHYGAGATPEGIVLEGKYTNPKADGLRESLIVK